MQVVSLSGSPSERSRSSALLRATEVQFPSAVAIRRVALRELPAQALVAGDRQHPAVADALRAVDRADVVLVATPIYKAAYSGLLKLFLDLLPQDGLRGKTVLPLATGGSLAHLLALDYALKPVLSALGARDILDGVFATDAQLKAQDGADHAIDPALQERLARAVEPLGLGVAVARRRAPAPHPGAAALGRCPA